MELRLKAYQPFGTNHKLYVGDLVFMKNKIMRFVEYPNSEIIKHFAKTNTLPLYREDFSIEYTDKYHSEHSLFDAIVTIKGKISFGVSLSAIQKYKLRWITKYYWIQNDGKIWALIGFIITTILTILGLAISHAQI